MFDHRQSPVFQDAFRGQTCQKAVLSLEYDAESSSVRVCRYVVMGAVIGLSWLAWACTTANAQSWITAPSYYTHDPQTGRRVDRYQNNDQVVHTPSSTRSLYRHRRSTLQVGDSIDIYHSVEQYGEPVRPYGEWRFPYRPFSVPYPQWGPTFNGGFGYPGWGGPGFGGPGFGFPGYGPFGPGGVINGAGFPQQWADGYYPDVQRNLLPPQPFPVPNGPQINNNNNTITGDNNTVDNG